MSFGLRSLRADQIKAIVDIQLRRLKERLAERKLSLEVTDAARGAIASEGFDPVYRARPLKRVVWRHIEDKRAMRLHRCVRRPACRGVRGGGYHPSAAGSFHTTAAAASAGG